MKQATPNIIDSHHHLWRWRNVKRGDVMASPSMARDYLWPDFVEAWDGLPVQSAVFVQVRSDLDEVGFVEAVAQRNDRLRAMIAWAPLEHADAPRVIEQLRGHPLVRGVRRNTQSEPDPLFCMRDGYVAAVRLLGELGYVCEICIQPKQFDGAIALAIACPETTIVLEHIGKPDVSSSPPTQWLKGIEKQAGLPNVVCKVSVVVNSRAELRYQAERLAPYVLHVVQAFGWERVMFGSNWPISTQVVGYTEWVRMLLEILAGASADKLGAFFAGNAQRLYKLD